MSEGTKTFLNEYNSVNITSTVLKCEDRKVLVILARSPRDPKIRRSKEATKKTVVAERTRSILIVLEVRLFVRQ